MAPADFAIVIGSFVVAITLGSYFARRQRDAAEYFVGSRQIGWPLACLSLVATETSAVTFIGIPAMAFGGFSAFDGSWTFLQMALGFAIGRILVAALLVPAIRRGNHTSVYEYVHTRMGPAAGAGTALVFLVTRLFADGVRLFVTAYALKIAAGLSLSSSVAIIVVATTLYSLLSGIRGIVWVDAVLLVTYLAGAAVSLVVIAGKLPEGLGERLAAIAAQGKLQVFDLSAHLDRFTLWAGIIGGAAISLASHGTDHLMAQRYLMVPTDRDAKKVVIGSGIFVFFQFAFFLFLGSCLFCLWSKEPWSSQALGKNEVFPSFIVKELPAGIRGVVLSGIFATGMSALSGSINALAASTLRDLAVGLFGLGRERAQSVRLARFVSFAWAIAIGGTAFIAASANQNVVDLALGIASITYGGILGIFLLGRFSRAGGGAAFAGFLAGTALAACLFFLPFPYVGKVYWPWYVPAGATVSVAVGLAATRLGGLRSRAARGGETP